MYTLTKLQITEFIKKNEIVTVKELVAELGITQAAVHRALNKLMNKGHISKQGRPPQVFYFIKNPDSPQSVITLTSQQSQLLVENYLYIDPTGQFKEGIDGFTTWMKATKNLQKPENCVAEYLKVLAEANQFRNEAGLVEATDRFKNIFSELALDKIYYHDFYSLIKFGKTKMGQLLLHGKQAQDKKIISAISKIIKEPILKLIQSERIDAVAWVPHSLPRKIPFLKEIKKNLHLSLPHIEIVKSYKGPIPIAQKSLAKIEERILNAHETLIVTARNLEFKHVLVIDDAVGSGATMNEIALKLKTRKVKKITGFAIVGSYKGFEVIREV